MLLHHVPQAIDKVHLGFIFLLIGEVTPSAWRDGKEFVDLVDAPGNVTISGGLGQSIVELHGSHGVSHVGKRIRSSGINNVVDLSYLVLGSLLYNSEIPVLLL
jgi:hypothetical protein